MTDNRLQLPFGLNHGLIEGMKAAWGARLIFPDDLVYDRQGVDGDKELVDKTLDWLNEQVDMIHTERVWNPKTEEMEEVRKTESTTRMGHARWKARQLYATGEMTAKDTKGFVLYLDGEGAIIASPNGSHGYLYVSAYIYEALPMGHATPSCDGTEIVRHMGE